MDQCKAQQFLPLITALAEGKTIQFNYRDGQGFKDASSPHFNGLIENYRIKPEKLVMYANKYEKDDEIYIHHTKKEAIEHFSGQFPGRKAVKMVEADEKEQDC